MFWKGEIKVLPIKPITKIKLDTVAKVQQYFRIATSLSKDVELAQGKYLVSGQSLMGIFTFNLEEPIDLIYEKNIEEEVQRKFKQFIVK